MTDNEIITLVMRLPADKREALLTKIAFEQRGTLAIARQMLGCLVLMSKLCGNVTKTTMADMLRDAADCVERPALVAAE